MFSGNDVIDVSLVVGWQPPLPFNTFRTKLPHFTETAAKKAYQKLNEKVMRLVIDWNSITEKEATIEAPDSVKDIRFKDNEDQTETHEYETSGHVFLPNRIIGSNVEMVGRYECHYRGATDEAIAEFTKEYAAYEYELTHCRKLLHELPIALANSLKQTKIARKALKEDYSELDNKKVNEGMMGLAEYVWEQGSIEDEIEKQEVKLKGLIGPKVNEAQFIARKYQPRRELPYRDGFIRWGKMTISPPQPKPKRSRGSKRKQKEAASSARTVDDEEEAREVAQRLD